MLICLVALLGLVASAIGGQRGSLTFVVDDTGSMQNTIDQVKKVSTEIMDIVMNQKTPPIEDIVLVTFNDPGYKLRVKAKSASVLEREFKKISADGGGDCPEYSMSGLELALSNSGNNSFVFVFTDSDAKDKNKWEICRNMAQDKQTPVNFVITYSRYCNYGINRGGNDHVYFKLARQTNGQVFRLEDAKEINDLRTYVKTLIAGDNTILVSVEVEAYKRVPISFTVDEQTEFVTVSASGKDVELDISSGPTKDYKKLTWAKNYKMLRIDHPINGTYIATVFGSSSTTLRVFGRTDFNFEHGFSTVPVTSLSNTDKQPIDGSSYYLVVSVADSSKSVTIKNALIQTTEGRTLQTLTLKKVSEDVYITELFKTPSLTDMINIIVEGIGIKTHRPIRRRSKTPVVIRKQDIKPRVTLDRISLSVDYRSDVGLVCNVQAHPRPKITWLDEAGTAINILKETANPPYDYTSLIKLSSVIKSQRVRCSATNEFGTTSQDFRITVKSPFVLRDNTSSISKTVQYGSPATISCNIESKFELDSMKVEWFKKIDTEPSKFEAIANSPNHLLFNDNIDLKIHSVKEGDEGKYVCRAFIIGDESAAIQVATELKIMGVAPKLRIDRELIKVNENSNIHLKCNIMEGYPRPSINWIFRKNSRDIALPQHTEDLPVKADIDKSGDFICVAKNEVGNVTKTIKVVVEAKPAFEKGNNILTGKENESITLSCRIVKGNPKPKLIWEFKKTSSDIYEMLPETNEFITISKLNIQDAGSYRCVALSVRGSDERVIDLLVEAPPKIQESKQIYTAVESDAILKLPCNVTGYPKPSVVWTMNGTAIQSDGEKYLVTDGYLVIKNPTQKDSNNYTCEAENKYGSDKSVIETFITPTMEFMEDRGDDIFRFFLQKESIELNCGKKSDKVVWFKESIPMNITNSSIFIPMASEYNDGNYTCRISSDDGVTTHNYVVDVGYPPVFENKVKTKINWNGDHRYLRCEVSMKPENRTVKVEWTYNGRPLNTMQQVQKIVGFGNYTCKIANIHGQVQRNFSVFSTKCFISAPTSYENVPVILNQDSTWPKFETAQDYFVLPHKDAVKLSCKSLRPNGFKKLPQRTEIVASCKGEDEFIVGDKSYKFDDLMCKEPVSATVQKTGQKCFQENTELIKVGFLLEDDFAEVYEVCYDYNDYHPLYTRTVIPTSVSPDTAQDTNWLWYNFRDDNGWYNCTSSSSCCYFMSQFVSPLDVQFGPPQGSTAYLGLNTMPLWRSCDPNQPTWSDIENVIRAEVPDGGSIVWSGGAEYRKRGKQGLKIQDIARYLWKVVKNEDESFAVIYVNDPAPKPSDVRCKGVCPPGIPFSTYVYCCSIPDFAVAFDIPETTFD